LRAQPDSKIFIKMKPFPRFRFSGCAKRAFGLLRRKVDHGCHKDHHAYEDDDQPAHNAGPPFSGERRNAMDISHSYLLISNINKNGKKRNPPKQVSAGG
jgi:hypothetical protein